MSDLHHLSALELHRYIRDGEFSSLEATDCFLDRIERYGDALGAFVSVTAEAARDQARRFDEDLRQGQTGPLLAGVPTAVKDLMPVRRTRTTFGSAAHTDNVADHDGDVVELLRTAAMPLLGKTSTAEFGFASYTEPDVAPPARCPWNPRMSAGGSSGGAAAAVAAGLVPVAHGSDSAGSLRIPASMCGVVGVKPTRGRISNGPSGTERFGLASQGVLSRTVADAAALLDRLCVRQPGDPHPLPDGGLTKTVPGGSGPLRVEVWTTSPLTGEQPHPECRAAVERSAAVLEELGHKVTWAEPPGLGELLPTFLTLWTVSAATAAVPDGMEDRLQPLTRALREKGRETSGVEVGQALDTLATVTRSLMAAMGRWDVLLTPSVAQPASPVGALRNDADPWDSMFRQAAFAPYTAMWNCTGHPALSLPAHWTPDGLPVGIQLVGRLADDARLLSVAEELETGLGLPPGVPDERQWLEFAPGAGAARAQWF